jgi:carotenoid cleavage dioxygenase
MDFDGKLKSSFTAHPKIDAKTGELFFFSYFPPTKGQVSFFKATNTSGFEVERKIQLQNPHIPHMFHDFAVTQTQALWLDFSLEISPLHPLKGQEFILFKPNKTAHLGWHSRDDPSVVQWAPIQGGAAFHNGVAWDENDSTSVILGCRADHVPYGLFESDPPHGNSGGKTRPDQMPFLYEWRLNRADKSVTERFMVDKASGKKVPCEFPNADLKNGGRRNRFVFAVSPDQDGKDLSEISSFVKYDLDLEKAVYNRFNEHETIGEAFFVRDYSRTEEDGGSVICFVFNQKTLKSRLAVVDAQSMKEVASVQFDVRIPQGFHTLFVSKTDLERN